MNGDRPSPGHGDEAGERAAADGCGTAEPGAPAGALPPIAEVERYLYEHIPLSRALGVRIARFDAGGLRVRAPLEPNLNHRRTAFGGSLSALAILAGWTRVTFDLRASGRAARVVVQSSRMDFDAPAEQAFEADVAAVARTDWQAFLRTLDRRGKARLTVRGVLRTAAGEVARFETRYVALTRQG